MKKFSIFKTEKLNESASVKVKFNEDYEGGSSDQKKELKNIKTFKHLPVSPKAVEITKISGKLGGLYTRLVLEFSNGEELSTDADHTFVIYDAGNTEVYADDGQDMEKYIGKTGTILGDMLSMYGDWLDGKLQGNIR